jgi:hypothetical protein
VEHAREKFEVPERHAKTQRYAAVQRINEDALTEAIIALPVSTVATDTGELRRCCSVMVGRWEDRVQRNSCRRGLKIPQKQRPVEGCG